MSLLLSGILPKASFTHILFNITLNVCTKLCVFCLLRESYLRWSQMQGFEQNNDPADIIRYTNEWECLGWQLLVYCSWKKHIITITTHDFELSLMLKAILLSSYGNILLIPIVIWEHDYSPPCFSLIKLFVLTSNSQAIRVILYCSRKLSPLAVCVGLLLETCIAQAFQTLPWSIPDILPFQ
uniref:Protein ARV n=1 Tax=Oncorhynchus kisutch TaxID=8019 RepID=A0A8C7G2H6_ONCKI